MSDIPRLKDRKESAIQVAKREIAAEQQEKDVKRLKIKYRELAAAEKVLNSLTIEVADLEEAITEGN
jgi:hypothetical protein